MQFRLVRDGETFSDDPDVIDVKIHNGSLALIVSRADSRDCYETKDAIKPGEGQIGMSLYLARTHITVRSKS